MTRRAFFKAFAMPALAATAIFCFSARASALAPAEAKTTLQSAVNFILSEIKKPAFSNPAERDAIIRQIESEVRRVFDFEEFSMRTVGPRWRQFNQEEKKRFSDAFADLLFNTYLNKITGYNGEQVIYKDQIVDGDRVQENTIITMKDGKQTPVSYRMLPKNGAWRVYDVIIENMSLVKNYRTQFQDILNTASPRQLIARVKAKAEEVAAQGAKH